MEFKMCCKCKQKKPVSEFYISKEKPVYRCKICEILYHEKKVREKLVYKPITDLIEEVDGVIIKEQWKPIIGGYESKYEISSFGRVKSLARKRVPQDVLMITSINSDGYVKVTLYDNNKIRKQFSVHILVGKHFIDNPDSKREVNHKKGNKRDNRYWELEWATHSENIQHSVDMGLTLRGMQSSSHKLKDSEVLEIFKSPLSLRKIAKLYNVGASTISSIKLGKSWSHLTIFKSLNVGAPA